jgi:hypothetical protein
VGPAALPGGDGQVGRDRLDQPGMGVTGDQANSGQAASCEVGEELVPCNRALRRAADAGVRAGADPGDRAGTEPCLLLPDPSSLGGNYPQGLQGLKYSPPRIGTTQCAPGFAACHRLAPFAHLNTERLVCRGCTLQHCFSVTVRRYAHGLSPPLVGVPTSSVVLRHLGSLMRLAKPARRCAVVMLASSGRCRPIEGESD